MKKILWVALAIITIAGCKSNNEQTTKIDGLAFDSILVDTTLALMPEPNSPTCHVSLSLQYAKGNKAQLINDTMLRSGLLVPDYLSLSNERLTFKAAIDSFVNKYLVDYKKEYGTLYREDKEHAASYNCVYSIKTRTQAGDTDVLNYIATISTYGGGAYPVNQTIVKNFNVKTGKLIRLHDVFVPGYEQTLKDMIAAQVIKKFKVKDIDDLKKEYIFADGNIYIPDNFILTEDDITFIYCEDEIASHAVGEIRLTFSKDDLNNILK